MTTANHKQDHPLDDASISQNASQALSEKAGEFRETAEAALTETVAQAQASMSDAQQSISKAGAKARKITEEQPLMVAAGALAVGVILGVALSNRRS